jgi:IS30 family transposase
MVGMHPSTICREIKRNGTIRGIYRAADAQNKYERRSRTSHIYTKISAEQWRAVEDCIVAKHSPEEISGRLKSSLGFTISHESVYLHIAKDAKAGGVLYQSLRRRRKKRRLRRPKKEDRRGKIKNRIGIEFRPEIVDDRSRIGDWEVDTIVSRESKPVLITAVERCSLATRIIRVDCKEAPVITKALLV